MKTNKNTTCNKLSYRQIAEILKSKKSLTETEQRLLYDATIKAKQN